MNTRALFGRGWPIPVLRVPALLNPFEADGVDMCLALMQYLPYESVKYLSVLSVLQGARNSGVLEHVHTLIEATSGNTGVALALQAGAFGIPRVKLVVPPDLPAGKRDMLVMAGAELVSPLEEMNCIATARKLGGGGWREEGWTADNGVLNLDQYGNPACTRWYAEYAVPLILRQLKFVPSVFVAGIGTGGSAIGFGNGLRSCGEEAGFPKKVVGVFLKKGEEVPGVRDLERMGEIRLPWRKALSDTVEVTTRPSYLASLWLGWVMGLNVGPSSGLAYLGALKFIHEQKSELGQLRDGEGKVRVLILCPDGNRSYGDRFLANIRTEFLKPFGAPSPWKFPGLELW